jgi:hypothetical protein
MKSKHYEQEEVLGLLPLLGSIGREIEERTAALEEIEARIESLSEAFSTKRVDLQILIAEAAAHRRGIRLARKELERLGCSVVGTTPLTFRIPGRVGEANHSFVWQTGDPVLK